MSDALAFMGKRRTPRSVGADRDYFGRHLPHTLSEDSVYMFLAARKITNEYGIARGSRLASHREGRCHVRKANLAGHAKHVVDARHIGFRRDLCEAVGRY